MIEVPNFLAHLKRDPRGYPHPFLMLPDSIFTMDGRKQERCVQEKLCMICGRKLDNKEWFIGGHLTAVNRLVVDPAMHERCARYSLKVCPFLANSEMKYRKRYDENTTLVVGAAPDRQGTQCLFRTSGAKPILFQGQVWILCNRWDYIEHWRNGEIAPTPIGLSAEELNETTGAFDECGAFHRQWKTVDL